MEKLPLLYKKVYWVSFFIAAAGLGVLLAGYDRAENQSDMNGYGLIVMGGFAIIVAIIILAIYGRQEQQCREAMGTPLLAYTVSETAHEKGIEKTAEEIKGLNKLTLLILIFMCVMIALVGAVFLEEKATIILISIGIAVFFSVAASLITTYRIRKLKVGSRHVVLAEHGVFTAGEFHAWTGFGSKLVDITYKESAEELEGFDEPAGMISGSYEILGAYRANIGTFNLVVPPAYKEQAREAVRKIKQNAS